MRTRRWAALWRRPEFRSCSRQRSGFLRCGSVQSSAREGGEAHAGIRPVNDEPVHAGQVDRARALHSGASAKMCARARAASTPGQALAWRALYSASASGLSYGRARSECMREAGAEPGDLDDLADAFGVRDGHGLGVRLVNPRARIGPRAASSLPAPPHPRRQVRVRPATSREEDTADGLRIAENMTEPKFPWFRWSIASVARTPVIRVR